MGSGSVSDWLEEDAQGPEEGQQEDDADPPRRRVPRVRERPSVLMYLPPELAEDLEVALTKLRGEYRREHGRAPGKNRTLYPAILRAALENMDSVRRELGLEEN